MKIVLSAHIDLNKPVKYIKVDDKEITGLVDNFAGVFAAYQAAKKTGLELFLTNFEEVNLGGANQVAKDLQDKDSLIIVVDTCTDAKDKKAYIGNPYYIDTAPLKKEFGEEVFFMDGFFEPKEDETAAYGWDNQYPTFFFGIPVTGEYHDVNNKVSLKTIDEAEEVLVKVINWIKSNPEKVINLNQKRLPINPLKNNA